MVQVEHPRRSSDLNRVAHEEFETFAREGFLVKRNAFSSSEVAAFLRAFDRLEARARDHFGSFQAQGTRFVLAPTAERGRGPSLQRAVWCGGLERDLLDAGTDPRIVDPALALLGELEADQLINQAHFKRPGDGVAFPMHQDAWNRRWGTSQWLDDSPDGGYVQVLLVLDPMGLDNGPLLVVPGSHRYGALQGPDLRARVEDLCEEEPPVPLLADPGTLVFFGPFLVHGSRPNRGTRPRRALVNGFARPGVNQREYPGCGLGVRRRASVHGALLV